MITNKDVKEIWIGIIFGALIAIFVTGNNDFAIGELFGCSLLSILLIIKGYLRSKVED